ncbi:hypothetical protein Y032_0365g3571, partial [Ancylostoma ceylanicum]
WPLAYVPIQILAVITFVYLCFFFFFAFKTHPSSNLAELSVIMEDELIRLSILTSEAVKSMKAAQSKKPPPLILMKHPEDPTQESLEDVCCSGTTCKTMTNVHKRFPRGELAPIIKQHNAVPNCKIGGSGANALSHSHTNKMVIMKQNYNVHKISNKFGSLKSLGFQPKTKTAQQLVHPAPHRQLHAPRRSAEKIFPMHEIIAPTYLPSPDGGRQRSVKAKKATRL